MLFTFDLLVSNTEAALRVFKASVTSAYTSQATTLGVAALHANDLILARSYFSQAAAQGCSSGEFWLALTDTNIESKMNKLIELCQRGHNAACTALLAALHASREKPNISLIRLLLLQSIDAGSLIGLYNASILVDRKTRTAILHYVIEHATPTLNFHDFMLVKNYVLHAMHYFELTTFGFGNKLREQTLHPCPGLYRFFSKVYRVAGNEQRRKDALYKAWRYDNCVKSMLDFIGDNVTELRRVNHPMATQAALALETYPMGFVGYSERKFRLMLAGDVPMYDLRNFRVAHVEAHAIPLPSLDYEWSSDSITSIEIVKCGAFFNESLLALNNLKRIRLRKIEFTPSALNLALALMSCGVKRIELDRCVAYPTKASEHTVKTFKRHCTNYFFSHAANTEECRAYLSRCSFRAAAELTTRGRQHVLRAAKCKMIGNVKL